MIEECSRRGGKRIGEKKKYMCGWVGLGWVWRRRGMGEGDCSECKVFFLGRWSFVLYFSKWLGGGFLSCWFPRGYL